MQQHNQNHIGFLINVKNHRVYKLYKYKNNIKNKLLIYNKQSREEIKLKLIIYMHKVIYYLD